MTSRGPRRCPGRRRGRPAALRRGTAAKLLDSTIADLAEPGDDFVLANLGRAAADEGGQAAFQVERRHAGGPTAPASTCSSARPCCATPTDSGTSALRPGPGPTERNQAARQLRTEARLRPVIASAPIVLTAYATDGICRFSEGRAFERLGITSSERTGCKTEVTWLLEERLDRDFETVAFRVVQEALADVAKHADATTVRVYRASARSMVVIMMADDGIGFDPEAAGEAGRRHRAPGPALDGRADPERRRPPGDHLPALPGHPRSCCACPSNRPASLPVRSQSTVGRRPTPSCRAQAPADDGAPALVTRLALEPVGGSGPGGPGSSGARRRSATAAFASTWATDLAPGMATTPGWWTTRARATWAGVAR